MMVVKELPNTKAAARTLEEHLKLQEYGTFIPFEEMKKIIGFEIRKYRYVLEAVKRALLRHHNRVLLSVRGKGYEIGTPNAILSESKGRRKRCASITNGSMQMLATIDLSGLPRKERLRVINEQCKNNLIWQAYQTSENKLVTNKKKLVALPDNVLLNAVLRRAK